MHVSRRSAADKPRASRQGQPEPGDVHRSSHTDRCVQRDTLHSPRNEPGAHLHALQRHQQQPRVRSKHTKEVLPHGRLERHPDPGLRNASLDPAGRPTVRACLDAAIHGQPPRAFGSPPQPQPERRKRHRAMGDPTSRDAKLRIDPRSRR